MQIVVVDDESVVVSLVRDALEDEGYTVHTYTEPHSALQFLTTNSADLLLTDIRMPGLNGIELVKQARAANPELQVIFMTGYANLNSAKEAIKQGASDYIMKPFELSEIRQAVKQAVFQKAELVARTTDQELSKLTDLSDMLFTSNDIDSIIAATIKFAVVHLRAEEGAVIICRADEAMLITVNSKSGQKEKRELPSGSLLRPLERGTQDGSPIPEFVSELGRHPFWQTIEQPSVAAEAKPEWAGRFEQILVTPISLGDRVLGYFMFGGKELIRMRGADFKFISFTSRQLAITLENLFLLQETQHAYGRLKELQEMIIDMEKMATRGEMSAEVGHELNNFLGVVSGNLSLIQLHVKKQNYEALDKHVGAINRMVDKMTRFTSNLMDVSAATSKFETLYLDRLLKEVVDYLRPQKRFRGLQLHLKIGAKDVPLHADATQLQQLLQNLFNNAADACARTSRPVVSAELSWNSDEPACSMTIADTGCGFDTASLEKAFKERFTTKPHGHGYGLFVCKRIVDNHRGQIKIDSKTGEGTTVSIRLPVTIQTSAPSSPASKTSCSPAV